MLVLTGMTEGQKNDRRIMKQLDTYTKLTPRDRMDECKDIVKQLKKGNEMLFNISEKPEAIEGLVLDDPSIKVANNKTLNVVKGNINLRNPIFEPHKFKDWLFVYSFKDPKEIDYDRDVADSAVDPI